MKKHHKKNWNRFKLIFHLSASVFVILTVSTCCLFGFYVFVHRMPCLDIKRLPPHSEQYVLATVSLVIGIILSILFSRMISIPLQKIYNALGQISVGDYNIKLTPKGLKPIRTVTKAINDMSEELNSIETMRNDFINNFSHEFKTPIVSISGFAKMLKDSELSEQERQEYLDIIINESHRLSQLSSNVLNLSKLDNQSIITDVYEYDVTEQIRYVIILLEQKWEEKNITIDFESPEYFIYANEELLSQVWINLLDNAIKFSPYGSEITIRIAKKGNNLNFTFADSGKGMDEKTAKHAFERFFQGDISHKSNGHGIGLAISKKICELHHGSIEIKSSDESGTVFEIILPIEELKI